MSLIIDLFTSQPTFYLVTVFIFSLLVGSFLNVVILRLPVMMKKEWREECCEFLELENTQASTWFFHARVAPSADISSPRSRISLSLAIFF